MQTAHELPTSVKNLSNKDVQDKKTTKNEKVDQRLKDDQGTMIAMAKRLTKLKS